MMTVFCSFGCAVSLKSFISLKCHMTEEDFTNLKYDVDRHEGDLDTLSKHIDKLQADLEGIIAFTNNNIGNLARQ